MSAIVTVTLVLSLLVPKLIFFRYLSQGTGGVGSKGVASFFGLVRPKARGLGPPRPPAGPGQRPGRFFCSHERFLNQANLTFY